MPAGAVIAALFRHVFIRRASAKWEDQLAPKCRRHVVAEHIVTVGPCSIGLYGSSEQVIQEGKMGGVVSIDRFGVRQIGRKAIGEHSPDREASQREGQDAAQKSS